MILDTNAVSAIAKGEATAVREFASSVQVALPVVVLGEYRFGILQSRHRSEYERWLNELLHACSVLEIQEETTHWYAELRSQLKRAGTPIPPNDAWIAALALQHSLPILSRDRHFDSVPGVQRVTW